MDVECILCFKCICNALQEIVLIFFHMRGKKISLLNFDEESYFEILLSCAI